MADFPPPAFYIPRWQRWAGADTVAEQGRILICAYHIDFDERPSYWIEVDSAEEARHICDRFDEARGGHNVDFAVAYDDTGRQVCAGGFGAE